MPVNDQRDEILDLREAQFPRKVDKKVASAVLLKIYNVKIAAKVVKYLGLFCQKIRYQAPPKIAQSGHTANDQRALN